MNYGRPFNVICLTEKVDAVLPEILHQLKELTEQGKEFLNGLIPKAQKNVFAREGNLFRLPYLLIFL